MAYTRKDHSILDASSVKRTRQMDKTCFGMPATRAKITTWTLAAALAGPGCLFERDLNQDNFLQTIDVSLERSSIVEPEPMNADKVQAQ